MEFDWDDRQFQVKINKLIDKVTDKKELVGRLAVVVQGDLERHFDDESDSSGSAWQPLSDTTLKLRRNKNSNSVKILQDTGFMRRINFEVIGSGSTARIGTPAEYGELHNTGGWQDFYGHSVFVPRREWAFISDRAKDKMRATMKTYFQEGI